MAQANIVIINTGCANISSVKFALERLKVKVTVSDEANVIKSADKVFLPGVGTATAAMQSINAKGLAPLIQKLTQPVLGVCLGMQLMVDRSAESTSAEAKSENIDCLSLIPGTVERMQVGNLRLPHMGWNTVKSEKDNPLFHGIAHNHYFYFVHSFCVAVGSHTLATCDYGASFSAALHKDNFYGVQFHPERSGDAGATLLKNFVENV
jgi:glutamine amidotransferase